MSKFIVDRYGRPISSAIDPQLQTQRASFSFPAIEVPSPLKDDLEANPSLVPRFYHAVGTALTQAMNNPITRPAIFPPSERTLKEWVQLCYTVLIIMRREMNFSLHRCFSILPNRFFEALKQGVRPEDLVEKTEQHKTAWAPGNDSNVPETFIAEPVEVKKGE